jgi:predicted nuclease of restriction endonuclease-like RecB superfamily
MLTGDLLRYRVVGNEIVPRYITRRQAPRYLHMCRKLIQLYQISIGKAAHVVESALAALEEKRTDYKVIRGLAKLLEEHGEFRPEKEMDYASLRHRVFSLAQEKYPIVTKSDLIHQTDRQQVLSAIAHEIGFPPRNSTPCFSPTFRRTGYFPLLKSITHRNPC